MSVEQAPAREARARPGRTWLLPFVGFFLILGAWSVAAPYSGTPDEQEHILRAAGAASGQLALPPASAIRNNGSFVDVPQSLVRDQCWQFKAGEPASCAVEPGGDETVIPAATGAGRYYPLYYLVVGGPLAVWPDWTGVILARLLSAAVCAAFLAFALTDAMRWSKHKFMSVGVLVATTPMIAHMGGAINPSGLELAAGVAFFTAAVAWLYAPGAQRDTTLLWHTGAAALALASMRMAGPLWLALGALALLLPLRRAKLRELWNWRPVRWWALGVALSSVASVLWTIVFKTAVLGDFFLSPTQRSWATSQIMWVEAQRWSGYFDEMVGVTSWLDTRMPEVVYFIWQAVAAAVILCGFLFGDRAGRIRLVALLVAGIIVPYVMAVRYASEVGFITQGRYLLPVLVAVPILSAFLIQQHGLSFERSRTALRWTVVALLPLQFVCLAFTMVRWQRGLSLPPGVRNLNPFSGSWHPPLGSVTPILASLIGLGLIGWVVWTAAGEHRSERATPAQARSDAQALPVRV